MTGCDLLVHYPGIAISNHCFFVICFFQVVEIQCPSNINDVLLMC